MSQSPNEVGRHGNTPLPRTVRRTGESRGRLLEAVGLLAFTLSALLAAGAPTLELAFPNAVPPLAAHLLPLASLPLTLPAWAAARRHLARLQVGQADPQGADRVRSAAGLCRWALAATALGCTAAGLARLLLLALS